LKIRNCLTDVKGFDSEIEICLQPSLVKIHRDDLCQKAADDKGFFKIIGKTSFGVCRNEKGVLVLTQMTIESINRTFK